jgi:hypothetical protein
MSREWLKQYGSVVGQVLRIVPRGELEQEIQAIVAGLFKL